MSDPRSEGPIPTRRVWLRVALALLLVPTTLWCIAALVVDGPGSRILASLAGVIVVISTFVPLFLVRRPLAAVAIALVPFALVTVWWLRIEPSNARDWQPEVARLPYFERDGDRVVLHDVRNFRYRSESDFDEVWEDREIDLSKVTGVDFFLSYWGSPWIAHTIASWQFSDGPPLAISIETRKERGEQYSAVLGFFRQFELYYVVADERDVIGVRTNHRGEEVYLYRLATPPESAREILEDYLETIDQLTKRARWYNALSHNCTTTIRMHVEHVAGNRPFDWRILVNGRLDELGYERHTINTSLPFPEIRAASLVSEKARESPIGDDFSDRIRAGLPNRPHRP